MDPQILFALLCSVVRPLYAFSILIVLFTGSFYVVQWLLHTQQIFIQMTAYHLVTLLAVVVFPVLRFAHDHDKTGKM